MGPYCLSTSPVLGYCFPVGWEIRCTGYTPFYRLPFLLENFQMLLRDPQRVKLFICSKLFIFVFEISNPGDRKSVV